VLLSAGDLLLLYSDGVTADASGREFGEQRLLRILEANRPGPAAEIERLILEQVRANVEDRPFEDDVTVLVVRIASSQPARTKNSPNRSQRPYRTYVWFAVLALEVACVSGFMTRL
jgi:serine/threonine protein phosphatase PrpC